MLQLGAGPLSVVDPGPCAMAGAAISNISPAITVFMTFPSAQIAPPKLRFLGRPRQFYRNREGAWKVGNTQNHGALGVRRTPGPGVGLHPSFCHERGFRMPEQPSMELDRRAFIASLGGSA